MALEVIVPLAVFLAIALGVWGALSAFAGRSSGAEARLDRLIDAPTARKRAAEADRNRGEKLQSRVADAAGRLGQSMKPKNEHDLGKVRLELLNAGFRGEQAVPVYLGLKFLGLLIGLGASLPFLLLRYGPTRPAWIYAILAGGLGFYLPGLIVGNIKKRRSEAIFLGLPDALDLMVVCVEAGLGLDAAMRRVTVELAGACPVLCEEFAIANFQVQMGRPRKDVLRDLGVRTGVDDVRSLAAVVIQAEKFGSSIGSALRVQSDAMRIRRRQLAEERAAKTAVKIMIPLILFIFPGVFVVLVGPAAIQIADTFFK